MTGKERREMLRLKVKIRKYEHKKISFSISKFSVIDKERAKKNYRIISEVLIPTTNPLTEKNENQLQALKQMPY